MKNKFSKKIKVFTLSEKGFSFTFDGIIAALILGIALIFIASNSANTFEFSSQKLVQKQLTDDLLDSAIDLNYLQSFEPNKINGFIQASIPSNYDYQIQLDTYTLATNFNLQSSQIIGNTAVDLNAVSYIESKKLFLTYYNYDINKFSSAKLRVWLK